MNTKLYVALFLAGTLVACGGDDDPENNVNNENNINNAPDCTTPAELDVASVRDGGTIEADSCYLVNQLLLVDGGTLVVEEGAQLQFNAAISMEIAGDGRLTVEGTTDKPVFFTGQEQEAGFWKGVRLATSGADNVIDYLVIEHAGGDGWTGADNTVASLYVEDLGGAEITNCTIRDGEGHAFELLQGATVSFSGCAFSNHQYGGYVHPDVASFIAADNEFTGNENDVVRVSFGNNDGVDSDATWANIGVPWRIETRTFVRAELTLEPGTVLEFNQNNSLLIVEEGRLNAVGDAENPITFTGVEKEAGFWKGIQLETQGENNVLDFVVMEFGGSEGWTGGADTEAMFRIEDGAGISISNSTFRGSSNYAITAYNNVVFDTFTANTFEENAKVARFHPNIVSQVAGDQVFTGNTDETFRISYGNNDAVEVEQSWAALAVPYLITERTFMRAGLTLEAGTTVQFLETAAFIVADEGYLNAVGTVDSPIAFTAPAGEETAGFWRGIEIGTVSVENVFENVTISYAGADSWYGGANASGALHVNDGTLALTDVLITDIAGWGIDVRGTDGAINCAGVTFMNVTEDVKDGNAVCL